MDVQCISLENQSNLMRDYKDRKESIYTQFHYDPYQLKSFKNRYQYLINQTYKRSELVKVLKNQNKRWGNDETVFNNIEKLNDSNSVVVIGGQQAGLLTGPLYTIHKIISIILQAREQSEHLNVPVIPVFWIAGEDHDFEEINHIFTYQNHHLRKKRIQVNDIRKEPVSTRKIDQQKAQSWLDEIFSTFQETNHTKELYKKTAEALKQSKSYVDFFAILINQLFEGEGLVLVDSNDSELRKLETDYFIQIVEHSEQMSKNVVEEINHLQEKGYLISLDASSHDGHLFYHLDDERLLLYREGNKWVTKDEQIVFTKDELIETIKQSPEKFSNNVVTRPIMQELVFPVLSFIGGPGEIAYWSVLKSSFEILGLQFPIVTPRMSITLFKHSHLKQTEQLGMNIRSIINQGTREYKLNWLNRQTMLPIDDVVEEVKKEITKIHQPIQELASSIQSDLSSLAEKNLLIMKKELDFIKKRLTQTVKQKNEKTISIFDELACFYNPTDGLQERVWNIYYFLNLFGLDLPRQLLKTPPMWEQDHIIITI